MIGEKFPKFMQLYNGHGTWIFTNLTFCWTIGHRCIARLAARNTFPL